MSRKISTEETTIRLMGLEGLVIILRSLLTAGGSIFVAGKMAGEAVKRSSLVATPHVLPSVMTEDLGEPQEGEEGGESPFSSAKDEGADETKDGQGLMMRHDRKQKIQEEIETGILKFNLSPKKGLAYLASLGHLDMTPLGVAKFLHQYADKLDKTAIGDYLGREVEYENGFCAKALHEYVNVLDFSSLHFDEAIRLYLSGFRLPGEAQKIDRIMEKFAEKYYLQNRDVFASADMAFILAFSTIMLQTNLHNPAIRDDQRMTKEQFVRQNTGISSDGELPEHILLDIFDRIQANPIVLDQDLKLKKPKNDATAFSVFILSQTKRRQDAFNDERKEMVRASEAIFKQKRTKNRSKFVRSQGDAAYIRPMFEVVWAPMIGVFSQILEMTDDIETTSLCLEGFQAAIRIACRLDVNTARDTYVNSLAKFTTLESVKEMRAKHLDAIKMLISVALNDGDYLFESWGQILRCISHLSRLQLFGSGLHSDDMFFSEMPAPQTSLPLRGMNRRTSKRTISESGGHHLHTANGLDPFKLFTTPTRAETSRIIEESNAELVIREIDPVLIDRIFLNSHNLSTESVLHFITNLCQVSIEEISTTSHVLGSLKGKGGEVIQDVSSTPRVFSLQKLVEVADFNMHSRPRIAWAKLWSVLANHFTTVGVHENRALAMYAIDSLKQLSIKFLLKSELSNFNFQRLFLKPFEVIMSKSPTAEIKELILRCLDIMILACANNIRSGWRSIFSVFSAAAGHEKEDIAGIAFEITERLVTQQFDLLIYDFVELMNCLVAFVAGSHAQIALSALAHISLCSDHLAEGTIRPALSAQHPSSDTLNISWDKSKIKDIGPSDAEVFRLWWPVLLGLSTRVADGRVAVRTRALEVLHRVLREYGHLFSPDIWVVIFRGVLFPMMDSAKMDNTSQPQSLWPTQHPPASKDPLSWIATTAASVLAVYSSLFNQFYHTLTHALLPDLLSMIEGVIHLSIESLSKIALGALRDLIMKIPLDPSTQLLSPDVASKLCHSLCTIAGRQLVLNFEDAGALELDLRVPQDLKEMIASHQKTCPSSRSSSASAEPTDSQRSLLVKTPFGLGKVKYSVSPPPPPRSEFSDTTTGIQQRTDQAGDCALVGSHSLHHRSRSDSHPSLLAAPSGRQSLPPDPRPGLERLQRHFDVLDGSHSGHREAPRGCLPHSLRLVVPGTLLPAARHAAVPV
jgi:brefeldin A-inhibited guanine nucleotide-exchange protein